MTPEQARGLARAAREDVKNAIEQDEKMVVRAIVVPSLCRALDALAARVEELEAAQAWRPIETAPKDGTPILAWQEGWGARETRSLTYMPGSPGYADGRKDRWWAWVEPVGNKAHRWRPTRWLPLLPPPPEEKP